MTFIFQHSLKYNCNLHTLCVFSFSVFQIPWIVACKSSLSMGILQARILEWVVLPSSRGSPNPGMEPRSSALQVDSLLSELPGNPKNTGVGIANDIQNIGYCKWMLHTSRLCMWSDNGKTFLFLVVFSYFNWQFFSIKSTRKINIYSKKRAKAKTVVNIVMCERASLLSRVRPFVISWPVAFQILCPWGFSHGKFWSG